MREVVENSPQVVGYSCLEGIKGEIQNKNFKRELFDVAYPHGKLHLGRRTYVMGILNVTPDSFYDGKRYSTMENAVNHASKMMEEGADIIDVGGESTRPGAHPVPEAEELKRVVPLIKILSKQTRKPISIDTY
ncbi:MAG: dihydropteroate synthase, partial [Planctomycetota bacterium]